MIAKIPNFNLSLLGKDLITTRCAKDLGMNFDDHAVKTESYVKPDPNSEIAPSTHLTKTYL